MTSKLIINTSNTSNPQFKHTIIWNNILSHLKSELIESNLNSNHNRLKKQHSRFVAASVGGMLLIKQNIIMNTTNTLNNLTSFNHNSSQIQQQQSKSNSPLESIYFTGSQCVDIVYNYLIYNKDQLQFERQITREKCTKLCQTIMDSGVFEQVSNRTSHKFDDTSLKYYKFRSEYLKQFESENDIDSLNKQLEKTELCDQDDNYHKTNKENLIDSNNNTKLIASQSNNQNNTSLLFSKAKLINKTNNVNTKLKRKLTSMRRSSTIHTLLPEKQEIVEQPAQTQVKLDRTKSIDSNDLKSKFESNKLAYELLITRQITRELIIEKLLSLIDLPIIEHLLTIDEQNDYEYCQAVNKFDSLLCKNSDSTDNLNKLFNKTSLSQIQKSFECLQQTYDFAKSDLKEEWRKSALDCLEFIDWLKLVADSELKKNQEKSLILLLMNDFELYNLIKDFYMNKQKLLNFFLDDSFQPLFQNVLIFIKKSHYSKALEILNLGTLLLLKQTQAELKRLLKFLYLTANSTHAPRLCEDKPNNSIILNHFASCLMNSKLIGFEESRLLLNFMLNNFDNLFRLNKQIEESINKRKMMMVQTGREEALLEKVYCKPVSNKDYIENSKEQTTKALVDLINHIIDDPQISLKQKKLKLKALQRIHPEIYEKYFSDLF